jgi:hypothetical protein
MYVQYIYSFTSFQLIPGSHFRHARVFDYTLVRIFDMGHTLARNFRRTRVFCHTLVRF